MDAKNDDGSAIGTSLDRDALKHLLTHFRERIQCLDADLAALCVALDGPPEAINELAEEVLNDRYIFNTVDIREIYQKFEIAFS